MEVIHGDENDEEYQKRATGGLSASSLMNARDDKYKDNLLVVKVKGLVKRVKRNEIRSLFAKGVQIRRILFSEVNSDVFVEFLSRTEQGRPLTLPDVHRMLAHALAARAKNMEFITGAGAIDSSRSSATRVTADITSLRNRIRKEEKRRKGGAGGWDPQQDGAAAYEINSVGRGIDLIGNEILRDQPLHMGGGGGGNAGSGSGGGGSGGGGSGAAFSMSDALRQNQFRKQAMAEDQRLQRELPKVFGAGDDDDEGAGLNASVLKMPTEVAGGVKHRLIK